LETLIRRCAGLDVHKASVVACVRVIDDNGELVSVTQSFGTTTSDLLKLNDWLMSYAVTLVGMESTGVYWKPVYTLLESEVECWSIGVVGRDVPREQRVCRQAFLGQDAQGFQVAAHCPHRVSQGGISHQGLVFCRAIRPHQRASRPSESGRCRCTLDPRSRLSSTRTR
jgi:hypothetical protein